MIIDRIELYHVAMPLLYPWRTAYGEDYEIHSVLCRMSSGSCDGWGESTPLAAPCYSAEWAGGLFHVARAWLAPALLGQDIRSGSQLQQMLSHFKGNSFAKAVLDNAWWSLSSRIENRPLHELLGAKRSRVAVGADFGVMDSIDDLIDSVGAAVEERFRRVKLKFRPGWDLPMLQAVRQQFPDLAMHIDCNSGYRLQDLELFRQVDALGLEMIEQPLAHDDLAHHAQLQKSLETAVCLDESITRPERAGQALEMGSCRIVNVKPGRVGGLTNAVAIHDLCQRAAVPCWVGGMLESAVGSSQCVALAMLENFTYPGDIFPSDRFYSEDLSHPEITLCRDDEGCPAVEALTELPEPDEQHLQKVLQSRATLP